MFRKTNFIYLLIVAATAVGSLNSAALVSTAASEDLIIRENQMSGAREFLNDGRWLPMQSAEEQEAKAELAATWSDPYPPGSGGGNPPRQPAPSSPPPTGQRYGYPPPPGYSPGGQLGDPTQLPAQGQGFQGGMPGQGMPGQGMLGQGMPGQGMPGQGMPGQIGQQGPRTCGCQGGGYNYGNNYYAPMQNQQVYSNGGYNYQRYYHQPQQLPYQPQYWGPPPPQIYQD